MKSDTGSGRKRLRQEPLPHSSPESPVPLPFLQKSIPSGRGGVAGRTGSGAAAVRGADSLVLATLPAADLLPAPAPAHCVTAILWSLPHPEGWTMERGFPSFPSFYPVCLVAEGGTNERGSGVRRMRCARQLPPAPAGWTLMATSASRAEASTFVCTHAPLQVTVCAEVSRPVLCAHYEFSHPGTPRETF